MTSYVIAVYEVDRCYGGPEEGGWWYDTGELKKILGVKRDEDEAYATARRLNAWLDRLQSGDYRKNVNSVCYSGGALSVSVYEDVAPAYYPKERPYYS